ncbi:MAG: ferrochelatase [Oligoflexales bacterium]
MRKKAIIVVNLGTPASSSPSDVARYLREFLMDPEVMDQPFLLRWLLVNLLIVPFRAKASAKLYQSIWTAEGSPLLVNSFKLLDQLVGLARQDLRFVLAMRYGAPSLEQAFLTSLRDDVEEIVILPMYPQYAASSTGTCLQACAKIMKRLNVTIPVSYAKSFYKHPAFLNSIAIVTQEFLGDLKPDYYLFSYHGLPERHMKKLDANNHCRFDKTCCDNFATRAPNCYRAQCYYTTKQLVQKLGLPSDKHTTAFQSRLGRDPWIQPFTDVVIQELPKKGVRHLAVLCPSFVADCLETLEEITVRMQDLFIRAGGEKVTLIPCLNDHKEWVQGIVDIVGSQENLVPLQLSHLHSTAGTQIQSRTDPS